MAVENPTNLYERHQTNVTNLEKLYTRSRDNSFHDGSQRDFLLQTENSIKQTKKSLWRLVDSKTLLQSQSDAGFIEAIELFNRSARPLIFWSFASIPFLLDKLTIVADTSDTNLAFWGVRFSGLDQATLLQGIALICVYYFIRYQWNIVLLKLNYPHRVSLRTPFISGKNHEEIELARQAKACLQNIRDYSFGYSIEKAAPTLAKSEAKEITFIQKEYSNLLDQIKLQADLSLNDISSLESSLKICDLFKYTLSYLLITSLALITIFLQATKAFETNCWAALFAAI